MSTEESTAVERALELAKTYPVFPTDIEKRPVCAHGFKQATRDPEAIKKLFSVPNAVLVAVPTGPASGIDVLDIDPDGQPWLDANRARLPATRIHATRRGAGQHWIFQHPPGRRVKSTNGVIAPGVDIKGTGGYICWWPAHGSVVTNPELLAPWPEWLLLEIDKTRRRADSERALAGARNDAMISEAGRMRHYNKPEAEAWKSLRALNTEQCIPPLDERELRTIFDSAWKYPIGYFNTDMGNADRFRDKHGANVRFVYESHHWLHWNGTRFLDDSRRLAEQLMDNLIREMHLEAVAMPDGDARKAALRWAMVSESRDRVAAALAMVPRPRNIVRQTELDTDPWLLGTPEAVIDLRTGRPCRASQSQLITKSTRAVYDARASCPLWIKCLERWLPDADSRAFLKRFIGYALTGVTREQCLLLVFGDSATGKTTLLQTLEHIWGDYAKRTPASTWLAKGRDAIPNDVAALTGVRAAISTESERTANWMQSLLKAATGQETLSARFMRAEWFSFLPQFKPMFGTNYLPGFDGSDRAMVRRLRPVNFNIVIPHAERDHQLQSKLAAEGPGILRWAIDGCLEWQKLGLQEPKLVIDATKEYAKANDHVATFIGECCEVNEQHEQPAGELHKAYSYWCKDHNIRPALTVAQFKEALKRRKFKQKKGEHNMLWRGIRLTRQEATANDY
jgi:putative DNA primase/helicase